MQLWTWPSPPTRFPIQDGLQSDFYFNDSCDSASSATKHQTSIPTSRRSLHSVCRIQVSRIDSDGNLRIHISTSSIILNFDASQSLGPEWWNWISIQFSSNRDKSHGEQGLILLVVSPSSSSHPTYLFPNRWVPTLALWGGVGAGAVSLFMSGVPIFQNDVLKKLPIPGVSRSREGKEALERVFRFEQEGMGFSPRYGSRVKSEWRKEALFQL